MSMICIPIPDLHRHKTVDLEISVDGEKRALTYRVESFPWPEVLGAADKVDLLRSYLKHETGDWELVQIGPPDGEMVPITFRREVAVSAEAQEGPTDPTGAN